jgi:hypothetical protein
VGFDLQKALFRFFGDATAEHHFGSGTCQTDGHGAAKFTGATDDDSGFSAQVKEVFQKGCGLHVPNLPGLSGFAKAGIDGMLER